VILVSATQIVEIRVIAANYGEISELRRAEAPENATAHPHSRVASAKYYQMWRKSAERRRERTQVPWFLRTAACAAAEFKRWVGRARRALGR
jgi:hypothetical protein